MAKNTYGKFREFDSSSTGQDWTEYCEQMDFYFSPNKITDDKQQEAILLPTVGNEAFKLIRNLFDQANFKSEEATLDMIIKKVKDHLSPKPKHVFARWEFFDCLQKPSRSVTEFIVE